MMVELFSGRETALVIVDLQGANSSHPVAPHSADDVIGRVGRIIEAARRASSTVIYVRTSFLPDESDSLSGKSRVDMPPAMPPSRPAGWDELVDELEPLATEPVIVKRSWNAFYGSDLDLQLRRHGVRSVVMTGIATSFGVEGTARCAFDRGYHLVFVEDAMSSLTARQHDFSVTQIFPRIGVVSDTVSVIAAYDASRADAG